MNFTLSVWRQGSSEDDGAFERYEVNDISPDASFLEMLDILNGRILKAGGEPIAFDHDCREGICGACSMTINGRPHGPKKLTTACQLMMRNFEDGSSITIEPWRAKAFPVLKDLIVDRGAFERIQQAGGYISIRTGQAVEANSVPIEKEKADQAMDAATCIGCGACVAACPNGSAMLYTAAKVAQLGLLAQGQAERYSRVISMTEQMDREIFGSCTNHGECQDVCPKGISIKFIGFLNRDYIVANMKRFLSLKGEVKAQ